MPIVFDCPHCPVKIHAPETAAGHRVSCPRCNCQVEVPRAGPSPGVGSEPDPLDFAAESPRVRAESHPASPRGGARIDDDRPRRGAGWYDDERRYRADAPRINSAALGLGICSMVIGVASLFPAIVPCLGIFIALPMAGIALLLGAAGLTVSLVDRSRSIGIPIAGTVVSGLALAITLGWMALIAQAVAERDAAFRREFAAEERIRRAEEVREVKRRDEEVRQKERSRLAQLEADRRAQAKRDDAEEASRLAALKAATEGLRAYEEAEKGRVERGREELARAELEDARQDKARTEAEAKAETFMKKDGLSANDRQYVRGCADGRLKHEPATDPGKLSLDVTKPVKDGDLGVPLYPNRFLDPKRLAGTSSYMKIAQIVSEDELIVFPGYLCLKGVITVGLTAGLKDGSRVDLKGVTVFADGKGTYTNSRGEKESVARLIVVDFKKVSPVMNSEALKRWLAAKAGLAEAKAQVARQTEAMREAERIYKAEVARRMAEITELSGPLPCTK